MPEIGPSEISFSSEVLKGSFDLSDSFRKSGVLGKKRGEERNTSNQKVEEILKDKFGEGFVNVERIEATLESGTDKQKEKAEEVLSEIGLALSQDNEVLKAATEGKSDEFLTDNLKGAGKYVLTTILTDGKDDKEGIKMVDDLVSLFKLKKKANNEFNPNRKGSEASLIRKAKDLSNKLYDRYENLNFKEIKKGDEGRIETTMGYIKGMIESQESNNNKSELDFLIQSRELLNKVENSNYRSNDLAIGETNRNLINMMDEIRLKIRNEQEKNKEEGKSEAEYNPDVLTFSDIYLEVESRLAVHDSAFYMGNSGFVVSERGGINGALEHIAEEGRVLDKERLKFLLRDSDDNKFGLPIAEAWDMIQDANFDYKSLLEKVADSLGYEKDSNERKELVKIRKAGGGYDKGTTIEDFDIGYFLDTDEERKAKVDDYIISQLNKNEGADGDKAYQLAQKLTMATGEVSTFNFELVDGDGFAEHLHFAYYNADDARKGKNIGAMSNRGVQSLTSGWLRSMSNIKSLENLKAKYIIIENNDGKNTFGYYFGQKLQGKINPVKLAFLDNAPDPKTIIGGGINHFNRLVDGFNKTDPSLDLVEIPGKGFVTVDVQFDYQLDKDKKGSKNTKYFIDGVEVTKNEEKGGYDGFPGEGFLESTQSREGEDRLRSMYALGLLELIATRPDLGWTIDDINKLREIMVLTPLTDSAKPFLNESMWSWINKQVVANNGKRNFTFKQAFKYNKSKSIESKRALSHGAFEYLSGRK